MLASSAGLCALLSTNLVALLPTDPPVVVAIFQDLDGDGVVSVRERARQIATDIDRMFRELVDGERTADSVRAEMVAYAHALFGDLNADGIVDVADIALLLNNALAGDDASLKTGDMIPDGMLDVFDAIKLLEAEGAQISFSDQEAIEGLLVITSSIPAEELIGAPPARGPNDHIKFITRTWPDPLPSIPPVDWDWPPNHLGDISVRGSRRNWPPNHLESFSATWLPVLPGDSRHNSWTSHELPWPPNHMEGPSRTWFPGTGDPWVHMTDLSESWGPGHFREWSNQVGRPRSHIGYLSQLWTPHDHAQESSLAWWPPNHVWEFSIRWSGGQHQQATSLLWPASHYVNVTQSWPDPNRAWPANHAVTISKTWDEPRDHDLITSMRERLPMSFMQLLPIEDAAP